MSTLNRFMGILFGLALMLMPVAPTLADEAEDQSEELDESCETVASELQTTIDEIQALNQSGASDVEIRLRTASDALADADATINEWQPYIPYILVLNNQEKRAFYALSSAILGQVRVYRTQVVDILNRLLADEITETEAQTELNTLVDDTVEYLQAHRTDFGDKVKQTFKMRVKAAKTYTEFGIDFSNSTEESYEDMGSDTTKIEKQLEVAATALADAETYYAAGTDGSDDDIKNLRMAAVRLVVARLNLSKAEVALLDYENAWAAPSIEE